MIPIINNPKVANKSKNNLYHNPKNNILPQIPQTIINLSTASSI
jgi:hypothetical protein